MLNAQFCKKKKKISVCYVDIFCLYQQEQSQHVDHVGHVVSQSNI
jgi:hypothetical protein